MKKKSKWIRVKNVHPYIKDEQYSEDYSLVNRLYSLGGKKYPLLNIAIYSNLNLRNNLNLKDVGIQIIVSYKEKKNAWWDSYGGNIDAHISLELFDDLREMLIEAENKLNVASSNNK